MDPQNIEDVFQRKLGGKRITKVCRQGQSAWRQPPGETERVEVFGDVESNKFHGRAEFKQLMDIKRAARDAQRRSERLDESERWPPLMRQGPATARTESVGHRPNSKTARPVGTAAYGGG